MSADMKKVREGLKTQAELGTALAQYNLGNDYLNGKGVLRNLKIAAEWYSKSASKGFPAAQHALGNCYFYGEGVDKDLKIAAKWYKKAAEQGFVTAQYALGECYLEGDGVVRSMQAAAEWYRRAADQRFANAQYKLGECYFYGKGVKQNKGIATVWYMNAAGQGLSDAQYALAECYLRGEGVPKNAQTAVAYYNKAAIQRHAIAQSAIGYCYFTGTGVKEDKKIAIEWYTQAAEWGIATAQYTLGRCYSDGIPGVLPQDNNLALQWLEKAMRQQHEGAKEAHLRLKSAMASSKGKAVAEEEPLVRKIKADIKVELDKVSVSTSNRIDEAIELQAIKLLHDFLNAKKISNTESKDAGEIEALSIRLSDDNDDSTYPHHIRRDGLRVNSRLVFNLFSFTVRTLCSKKLPPSHESLLIEAWSTSDEYQKVEHEREKKKLEVQVTQFRELGNRVQEMHDEIPYFKKESDKCVEEGSYLRKKILDVIKPMQEVLTRPFKIDRQERGRHTRIRNYIDSLKALGRFVSVIDEEHQAISDQIRFFVLTGERLENLKLLRRIDAATVRTLDYKQLESDVEKLEEVRNGIRARLSSLKRSVVELIRVLDSVENRRKEDEDDTVLVEESEGNPRKKDILELLEELDRVFKEHSKGLEEHSVSITRTLEDERTENKTMAESEGLEHALVEGRVRDEEGEIFLSKQVAGGGESLAVETTVGSITKCKRLTKEEIDQYKMEIKKKERQKQEKEARAALVAEYEADAERRMLTGHGPVRVFTTLPTAENIPLKSLYRRPIKKSSAVATLREWVDDDLQHQEILSNLNRMLYQLSLPYPKREARLKLDALAAIFGWATEAGALLMKKRGLGALGEIAEHLRNGVWKKLDEATDSQDAFQIQYEQLYKQLYELAFTWTSCFLKKNVKQRDVEGILSALSKIELFGTILALSESDSIEAKTADEFWERLNERTDVKICAERVKSVLVRLKEYKRSDMSSDVIRAAMAYCEGVIGSNLQLIRQTIDRGGPCSSIAHRILKKLPLSMTVEEYIWASVRARHGGFSKAFGAPILKSYQALRPDCVPAAHRVSVCSEDVRSTVQLDDTGKPCGATVML